MDNCQLSSVDRSANTFRDDLEGANFRHKLSHFEFLAQPTVCDKRQQEKSSVACNSSERHCEAPPVVPPRSTQSPGKRRSLSSPLPPFEVASSAVPSARTVADSCESSTNGCLSADDQPQLLQHNGAGGNRSSGPDSNPETPCCAADRKKIPAGKPPVYPTVGTSARCRSPEASLNPGARNKSSGPADPSCSPAPECVPKVIGSPKSVSFAASSSVIEDRCVQKDLSVAPPSALVGCLRNAARQPAARDDDRDRTVALQASAATGSTISVAGLYDNVLNSQSEPDSRSPPASFGYYDNLANYPPAVAASSASHEAGVYDNVDDGAASTPVQVGSCNEGLYDNVADLRSSTSSCGTHSDSPADLEGLYDRVADTRADDYDSVANLQLLLRSEAPDRPADVVPDARTDADPADRPWKVNLKANLKPNLHNFKGEKVFTKDTVVTSVFLPGFEPADDDDRRGSRSDSGSGENSLAGSTQTVGSGAPGGAPPTGSEARRVAEQGTGEREAVRPTAPVKAPSPVVSSRRSRSVAKCVKWSDDCDASRSADSTTPVDTRQPVDTPRVVDTPQTVSTLRPHNGAQQVVTHVKAANSVCLLDGDDSSSAGTLRRQAPKQPDDATSAGTLRRQAPKQPDDAASAGTLRRQAPKQPDDAASAGTVKRQAPKQPDDASSVRRQAPRQPDAASSTGTLRRQAPKQPDDPSGAGTLRRQAPSQQDDLDMDVLHDDGPDATAALNGSADMDMTASQDDLVRLHERVREERKKEQQTAVREQQRLEDILHLCAEFEKQLDGESSPAAAAETVTATTAAAAGAMVARPAEKRDSRSLMSKIKTNGSLTKLTSPPLTHRDVRYSGGRSSTSSASEEEGSESGTIKRRPPPRPINGSLHPKPPATPDDRPADRGVTAADSANKHDCATEASTDSAVDTTSPNDLPRSCSGSDSSEHGSTTKVKDAAASSSSGVETSSDQSLNNFEVCWPGWRH